MDNQNIAGNASNDQTQEIAGTGYAGGNYQHYQDESASAQAPAQYPPAPAPSAQADAVNDPARWTPPVAPMPAVQKSITIDDLRAQLAKMEAEQKAGGAADNPFKGAKGDIVLYILPVPTITNDDERPALVSFIEGENSDRVTLWVFGSEHDVSPYNTSVQIVGNVSFGDPAQHIPGTYHYR